MNQLKFMTLIFCYFVASTSWADNAALEQLLLKHREFTARFEQVSFDENQRPMSTSSGIAKLSKEQRLRWETQAPWPQLLVVNGPTVWLYDPDLEQATYRHIDDGQVVNPSLLFSADIEAIEAAFAIEEIPQGYRFIPHVRGQFAEIRIAQDGELLSGFSYVDLIGQRTVIEFFNHDYSPIDVSEFQFSPPDGVEVVTSVE